MTGEAGCAGRMKKGESLLAERSVFAVHCNTDA